MKAKASRSAERSRAGSALLPAGLWIFLSVLLIATLAMPAIARPMRVDVSAKVSQDVLMDTLNGDSTSFIIFLEDQADLSAAYEMTDEDARGWYVYSKLREHAEQTQAPVRELLDSRGIEYTAYWAANMIVADGDRADVEALAARSDVLAIESNDATDWIQDEGVVEETEEEYSPGAADEANFVTPGVNNVQAPPLWAQGYNGAGIVVGNQDTGVRWTHNAIRSQYRGWGGSIAASDHNYNWWDAIHFQLPGSPVTNSCGRNSRVPCDDNGHGTHTVGTSVGDGGAGTTSSPNQVGVAPGAKWIACRNMDGGNGRPATYTECFQFFLAPWDLDGNNPDPTKRPHVMNNSWGCPPSEECAANTLKTIVENSMASGIFVVVSAGNSGSSCSTVSDPPALYGASFTVGSISGTTNALANSSSRGPVSVDGSGRMKPELVAPGVSVRSATRTSDTSYGNMSGTSMAGPHVVGTVALLWSARPHLVRDIEATKQLLLSTANPAVSVPNNSAGCGGIATIPNNHFGYGRVDVNAAYNADKARDQFITFDPLPSVVLASPAFSPGATSSSGLQVNYSASGACSVSGNLVYTNDVGECTITASQPGDHYYYAAASVTQSFPVLYASGICSGEAGRSILSPIKSDGSATLKKGTSVPARFRVCDANGAVIGDPGVVTSFVRLDPPSTPQNVFSTPPFDAFRFSEDQEWVFQINTSGLTGTQSFRIALKDGTFINFSFRVK
jgi:serine protease AprX